MAVDSPPRPMIKASRTLAVLPAVIGTLTLLGWQLDLPLLRSVGQPVAMNPMTAILFIIASCGIVRLPIGPKKGQILLSRIAGISVSAFAAAKLFSLFGLEFSLDRMMYTAQLSEDPVRPNQMAPNTAIAFFMLGISLTITSFQLKRATLSQAFSLGSAYIGFQSLLGYLLGTPAIFDFASFVPMALNTSIAMVSASVGLLLADPKATFVIELTRDLAGGILGRRLIPVAIIVPIGIGALRYRGQEAHLYSSEVGVTLMITAMVLTLVALIWWAAKHLNRYDSTLHGIMKDLGNLNRELETFSYSVSHDLRAPLRSIAGFSTILLEDHSSQLSEEAKSHLNRINTASTRMSKLIDGLLDLSRLSRKGLQVQLVNLTRIVETALADLRSSAPDKQVTADLQSDVTAWGDPDLLAIVVQNLVGNAWKFSANKTDPKIEFGITQTPRGPAYFVRDNGAGFDMQHARNLFGPFQRLHTAKEFEGTGIGLATVQRIISRHHGSIWAEAEPQKGATFYFTLEPSKSERTLP